MPEDTTTDATTTDKPKATRLEKAFAAAGRSVDDVLRVRDLIEYDNHHHNGAKAPAAPSKRRK